MGDYEISALDAYLNRAFKIIIVLPLTGATTSAFVFTIFRLIGWWPDIPMSTQEPGGKCITGNPVL